MGRCMNKVENHWIKQNYLYIYAVITSTVSSLLQDCPACTCTQ